MAGTNIGKAYVQIVPSAQGISGSISSALNGSAGNAGKTAGGRIAAGIKGAIAAAGIGVALAGTLKKAFTEGAALEQSIGGIKTLFKTSADEMIKNADNAYRTAGISANQYMEQATSFSASLLQSVGGDTKEAARIADMAIIDMSDNANKMGTNIEDIQNAYQGFAKQNYTMLDNLKLGYGGTKGEMERLLQDAEKLSGKKYDISNLNDVYEAIHVIQKDLDITGTSAKEASTTLSGSFSAMKAAASNFLGDLVLGRNIGPAMKGLVESASTFLFKNLFPAVGRIIMALPEAIGAFIDTGLPALAEGGMKLIAGISEGMTKGVPKLAKELPEKVGTALDSITENLPKVLAKGAEIVVGLVKGVVSNIPILINTAREMIAKWLAFLKENMPTIAKQGGELVGKLAKAIIEHLPEILAAAVSLAWTIIKGLISMIPTLIVAGANLVKGIATGLGGSVLSVVATAAKKVAEVIIAPIRAVITVIKDIVKKIKDHLSFSGLATTVSNVFRNVKNKIMQPIEKARDLIKGIVEKIKGFFKFKISLPHIKLPHFKISPRGWHLSDLLEGSIPSLGIEWYAKGGIFNSPAVVGVGDVPGGEAAVPLNQFWERMDAMADSIVSGFATVAAAGAGGGGDIKLDVYLYPSGPKMMEETVKMYDKGKRILG